jgi:hypothetical protein
MPNEVYANNNEVACKAASGKSICGLPDVCFTPPENPATPPGVPVPYPNTGLASDTTKGSRSVRISKKEVMLKNKSYFKTSYGDEAGCAAKKGMVSSVHRGKVYFVAWSMNVKVEGQNVDRHFDLTTHNHASPVPNEAVPWPYLDTVDVPLNHPCYADIQKEKEACKDEEDPCRAADLHNPPGTTKPFDTTIATSVGSHRDRDEWLQATDRADRNACLAARRCRLEPYKGGDCCCPGQTGHHLVEASSFFKTGRGDKGDLAITGMKWTNTEAKDRPSDEYDENKAPCICTEGTTSTQGSHGMMHTEMKAINSAAPDKNLNFTDGTTTVAESVKSVTYREAKDNATQAVKTVFPLSGCNPKCIEAQLDNYYNQMGVNDNTDLVAVTAGKADKQLASAQEYTRTSAQQRYQEVMEENWRKFDPTEAFSPDPLTGAPTGNFGLFSR